MEKRAAFGEFTKKNKMSVQEVSVTITSESEVEIAELNIMRRRFEVGSILLLNS